VFHEQFGGILKHFLIVLVFVSGMSSLALEMCASRFLAAYFGASILVWTIIISLMLLSLTIGYFLGGKLADAYPYEHVLCMITAIAALLMSVIPFVAQGVLSWSMVVPRQFVVAIFLDLILLFGMPVALLGCVSPFVIRLMTRKVIKSGSISGSLYAISTAGSILGVFLPVLWMIPAFGVKRTMFIFAVILFAISLWGLRPRWRPAFLLTLIPIVLPLGPLRSIPYLIYEQESYYSYIQVTQIPDGTRQLLFNDGIGIHSVYNPKTILTNKYWDDFLVAPYLTQASVPKMPQDPLHLHDICIIGLAGGTIARQFTDVYGSVPIDGVELDPAVVAVGRKYFNMTEPNLHVYTEDGRTFLSTTHKQYDVIGIDAYQHLYIPFHLTTKEFFTLIRSHLSSNGVLILNTIHDGNNFTLVQAFVNTMSQVFPAIYQINVPASGNTILMATMKPDIISAFRTNLAHLASTTSKGRMAILSRVANKVASEVIQARTNGGTVFTDNRAPVEQITDQLVFAD
jgi:spermidine synthase